MRHGGKRHGAGRPKGSKSRATAAREAAIAASGLSPLDYMIQVLRDESAPKEDRMWAAHHAAPYVHPRLQAVEHKGGLDVSIDAFVDQLSLDEQRILLAAIRALPDDAEDAEDEGTPTHH